MEQFGADGNVTDITLHTVKDKIWANYESIQADIFDHLLAILPEFDLRIFQNPSGHDFNRLLPSAAVDS
jgi:miniconductance mechanosensitive channel